MSSGSSSSPRGRGPSESAEEEERRDGRARMRWPRGVMTATTRYTLDVSSVAWQDCHVVRQQRESGRCIWLHVATHRACAALST